MKDKNFVALIQVYCLCLSVFYHNWSTRCDADCFFPIDSMTSRQLRHQKQ